MSDLQVIHKIDDTVCYTLTILRRPAHWRTLLPLIPGRKTLASSGLVLALVMCCGKIVGQRKSIQRLIIKNCLIS